MNISKDKKKKHTCTFNIHLSIIIFSFISTCAIAQNETNKYIESNSDDYVFDSALFQGLKSNQNALFRLTNGSSLAPGVYKLDLYLNNQYIDNTSIKLNEFNSNQLKPCFTSKHINQISINIDKDKLDKNKECYYLDEIIKGSQYHFDQPRLRLNLTIPQGLLIQKPRGYIPSEELNHGSSIAFVNYYSNYYHNGFKEQGESSYNLESKYLSLRGGINIGKWQFRQHSSYTNNRKTHEWNHIRSYVKRPILSIKSELSIGQLHSSGQFFSGLSFNGINLRSDERMLPDSQRGYAPVVQGIAKTTSIVSIYQNGQEIYQTTVAPGPFNISDLYPTNYNGDLDVIINEADGSQSTFSVPFSAVPESIRKGSFQYNLDLGQTRDIGENTEFANITTQYGLTNSVTFNSGFRIAEGYRSAMAGAAYTSFIGAIGTEATYSNARILNNNHLNGWMFGANYSKTFNYTNTTIALAGYRYSTEGYRELSDIISIRKYLSDGIPFYSKTYRERSRGILIVNQSIGKIGTLYSSSSISHYRNGKPSDNQLQLGYGKTFKNGNSLNLSISKQKIAQGSYHDRSNNDQMLFDYTNQTTLSLSMNIPLNKPHHNRSASINYTNNGNNTYQATLNGDLNKFDKLNYHIGFSYDDQSELSNFNSGLNKGFSYANTSINFSNSKNYWQNSASIQGAFAVHNGGITFSPYLSETFAIVEAKGAQGAKISNTQGATINKHGYAIIPALTPYKYNRISINSEGLPIHTEIHSGDKKVAPYSGAALKVNFKTRKGYPILIKSSLYSGEPIPIGSDIYNEKNEIIGLSGQNSQIYARTDNHYGNIYVQWGLSEQERCTISYRIDDDQLTSPLIRLSEPCHIKE